MGFAKTSIVESISTRRSHWVDACVDVVCYPRDCGKNSRRTALGRQTTPPLTRSISLNSRYFGMRWMSSRSQRRVNQPVTAAGANPIAPTLDESHSRRAEVEVYYAPSKYRQLNSGHVTQMICLGVAAGRIYKTKLSPAYPPEFYGRLEKVSLVTTWCSVLTFTRMTSFLSD